MTTTASGDVSPPDGRLPGGRRSPSPKRTPRRAPGWWRRNGVALLALVVLLPVSAAVIGIQEQRTSGVEVGGPDETVPAGATASASGARLGPVAVTDAVGTDVPEGARAVVATIPVELDGPPVTCDIRALRDAGGDGRRWDVGATVSGWTAPAGSWTTCPSEPDGSGFALSTVFVVPADADRLVLDLAVGPDGRLLRFELD